MSNGIYLKCIVYETFDVLPVAELPVLDYDKRFDDVISCRSGTGVNIDVGFTGHPDPTVDWFFSGAPLTSSGIQASVRTDPWHTGLTISNIKPNEAGLYKVKVTNKAGSKTATFTIEVKGMNSNTAGASIYPIGGALSTKTVPFFLSISVSFSLSFTFSFFILCQLPIFGVLLNAVHILIVQDTS